jgi:hypothetical protein
MVAQKTFSTLNNVKNERTIVMIKKISKGVNTFAVKAAEKVVKSSKAIKRTVVATTAVVALSVPVLAAPSGVDTTSATSLINIATWAVGLLIGFGGGLPALQSLVDGQNNDNPVEKSKGIKGLVITGIGVGGIAALKTIFSI